MNHFYASLLLLWLMPRLHEPHRSEPGAWTHCSMQPCYIVAKAIDKREVPQPYDANEAWPLW